MTPSTEKSRALILAFGRSSVALPQPSSFDAEEVLAEAIAGDFSHIELEWLGQLTIGLPIEDDVLFLIMGNAELPAALISPEGHRVVLGDGLLDITASLAGDVVDITARHSKNLDLRFMTTLNAEMSHDQYLRAWTELVQQLVSQVRAAPPLRPVSRDAGG